jgi:eukaryotic-like serine/threonine-protein kinase
MHELVAGDRVDQYELTELLARSGMASIFKAIDRSSGKTVALKVPHIQYEADIAFYQRFEREEKIGQKLDHPNIVRVLAPEKKTRMYLVMELAEGQSLRAVQGDGRMEVKRALDIATQIASALVYLHSRGIVHRDLKPDNVMLTADGQIKLLDFGIAMDEAARRLTWFGLTPPVGTPDYMAPEQVRGKRGDARTDIYALGVMLFEMITGDLPYPHGNVHATMRAKLNQDPRPPSELMSGIDPKIEEIIMHAIQRSPRERYATAKEMLVDLENPSEVVLRDRAVRRGSPLLDRLHIPGRILARAVLALVIGTLLILTLASGRQRRTHAGPVTTTTPAIPEAPSGGR